MRYILLAIIVAALPASSGASELAGTKDDKPQAQGKLIPLKGSGAGNPCAAYGPGFVRLAGSDTCVKTGGAIGIDAGGSARLR